MIITYNLDERVFKEQLSNDLNRILEKILVPRHREVLYLKFVNNLSYRQIASELGVTHQRVALIIKQIFKNIEKRMTEEDLKCLHEYYNYM